MMTRKFLLNIQMICKMFKKLLKNTILEKTHKVLIVFDDLKLSTKQNMEKDLK